MSKLAWIVTFAVFSVTPAAAESAIPNLLGTWKGESESIVMGPGNAHHSAAPAPGPRLNSIAFTMTIDKQDGRRFSGAFTSARGNDTIIAVISRNGSIYMVDDDGYTIGTILAPNRMELCYMRQSPEARVASCTEMTSILPSFASQACAVPSSAKRRRGASAGWPATRSRIASCTPASASASAPALCTALAAVRT